MRWLILLLVLSACSQQFHCKKCTSSGVIHDTLTVKQDVITERVKMDTIVEVRTKTDTVTIREKNLVIRYKKLAGDTIYLAGSCEPDTVKVEIRVPIATEVKTGVPLLGAVGLTILALVVGAGIMRLFR